MSAYPKNRRTRLGCTAILSFVLTFSSAVAAPTFYSTGTHILNGLDQDWLVSTGYGSFNTDNFVKANIWNHGSELWITDAGRQMDQYFTFRQDFNLTGYNASNTDLKFYWGCDDVPGGWSVIAPVFSLNGGAFQGAGTCSGYTIGNNLVELTSGFKDGENYIDFRVQGNYATNGMGLTVESFTAPQSEGDNNVPEPSTIALLGSGLLGLGLRSRALRKA